MAPVPASPPSWMSTLTFSIGDKKQIIVYTAILVSFIALFVIGFVYVLRIYNTSASDEESNTTSTPRPPLRILLPGGNSQRAPSSSSTLVTPFKTGPTPVKRSGSGPSPLGQHVHTDPAQETTEQDVIVTEGLPVGNVEHSADANTEVIDVVVIAPEVEVDNTNEEEIVASELEIDIADSKVNWLGSEPVLKIDSDMVDTMVLGFKNNKATVFDKERMVCNVLTNADAVNIGNAFLHMGEARSEKALESPAKLAMPASSRRGKSITDNGSTDSGPEGSPSVTSISSPSKSAKCGLLPFQLEPRRGDLWAAALDRLARHVTLEDHGEDTSSTTDNAEHVATGDAQYAREALDIKKEDGSFKQTYGNKMATAPEPSIGRTPSLEANAVSSETSISVYSCDTNAALDHTLAANSVLSHGKPHKEVRFGGDMKAEIGDHCRISYDVNAAYIKVKVATPVTTLRPLSGDSLYSTAESVDSNAPHRLSLLADLALGNTDSISSTGGSSGSIALTTASTGSALATQSSSEDSLASPSIGSDSDSLAQREGSKDDCGTSVVAGEHSEEDLVYAHYEIGPSESTQALRDFIMQDSERVRKERRREFEEQQLKRREEADKVYASFRERRRNRLAGLSGSPATAYTPALTPDANCDRGSVSPATPAFGSWRTGTPSPLLGNFKGASSGVDTWTFLPGNTGPDAALAHSSSGNSHGLGLMVQYEVSEDVPLPPRRAVLMSPSEEEMKPVINVEENLDENAEHNFHELGISYSTQALRNFIMKDCEKAAERRREDFEASMAVRQAQRAKQVVAILNESGELDGALGSPETTRARG